MQRETQAERAAREQVWIDRCLAPGADGGPPTPWEIVSRRFDFPFPPKPKQLETLNNFAADREHGVYHDPGTGKTFTCTLLVCYLIAIGELEHAFVLVPPIVIRNWSGFLTKVIDKTTGEPVTQVMYRGEPAKRRKLDLGVNFLIMSYEIFKKDLEGFVNTFGYRKIGLIADEAHKIKNVSTAGYKSVKLLFVEDRRPVFLATGTPITTPEDVYAYCKVLNPRAYRNKRHFEQLHVEERDDYDKVTKWMNLDLLKANFMVHASRLLKTDAGNPPPKVILYELDAAHQKLYDRVVDEQLVEFEDGRVLDAMGASALYHRCQQLILNWGHFADDPSRRPAAWDVLDETLDEIGDEKLVVFANYQLSNRSLIQYLSRYGVAYVMGGMTDRQRDANVDRFIKDPKCRTIVLQPEAGGVGLDGLQRVCSESLFLECPTIPRQFSQARARLEREGQQKPVNMRIAVADRTIQVRIHRRLLDNDDTVVSIAGGLKTLREELHGR